MVISMKKGNNIIMNPYKYTLIILLLLFFITGCSRSYKPSELKGYYKPLVKKQHSLNKEDINNQKEYVRAIGEGRETSVKYYFEVDNKYYYVLNDIIYTKQGLKITDLMPKSEGYLTDEGYLYYVYGEEREKDVFTLGGPIGYTLKDFKYRKLDMETLKDVEITKEEYEKLYFGLE